MPGLCDNAIGRFRFASWSTPFRIWYFRCLHAPRVPVQPRPPFRRSASDDTLTREAPVVISGTTLPPGLSVLTKAPSADVGPCNPKIAIVSIAHIVPARPAPALRIVIAVGILEGMLRRTPYECSSVSARRTASPPSMASPLTHQSTVQEHFQLQKARSLKSHKKEAVLFNKSWCAEALVLARKEEPVVEPRCSQGRVEARIRGGCRGGHRGKTGTGAGSSFRVIAWPGRTCMPEDRRASGEWRGGQVSP